jgi:hypothetical protein
MLHLDQLLAKAENPPFDRLARICVDVTGTLDGKRTIVLGVTTYAGNARVESPKKTMEMVTMQSAEDLELRVRWVMRATEQRRLKLPRVDEIYEARPLGFDGPLEGFEADLDRRLEAAEALLFPQEVTDISASHIPPTQGSSAACFARARFQGVMLVPHVIEVKLFDADLRAPNDERWPRLKAWSTRAAHGRGCTVVPTR